MWLIRFVVFLHETMGRTANGFKQRLSGIRYAHIAAGYPDPLVAVGCSCGLLWQGCSAGRGPRFGRSSSRPRCWVGSNSTCCARVEPRLRKLGWFYMLRASEYLPGCARTVSPEQPQAQRAYRSAKTPLASGYVACLLATARDMGRQQLQAWMQQWAWSRAAPPAR